MENSNKDNKGIGEELIPLDGILLFSVTLIIVLVAGLFLSEFFMSLH